MNSEFWFHPRRLPFWVTSVCGIRSITCATHLASSLIRFFSVCFSFPSHHSLTFSPSQHAQVFLFFFSLLFLAFPMSTVGNSPCQDDGDALLDMDNDNDYVSKLAGLTSGSSKDTASSWSPATPSALSRPSGLPLDAIAKLTHDKLQCNPEFMKHMNLVDILLTRETKVPSKCKSFFFYSIPTDLF